MKRQRFFRLDKKSMIQLYPAYKKTHYKMKEINELKKWQKIYHVNKIQKKTGLKAVLTQMDFKRKNISRNKKDYFIIRKRSIE